MQESLLHYCVTWKRHEARRKLKSLPDSRQKEVSLEFVELLRALKEAVRLQLPRYKAFEAAFETFRTNANLSLRQFRTCVQSVGLSLKDGKCYGDNLKRVLQDRNNRANLRNVKIAHKNNLKKCLIKK
jgi:pyruvate-formate lyase-activating enzyme